MKSELVGPARVESIATQYVSLRDLDSRPVKLKIAPLFRPNEPTVIAGMMVYCPSQRVLEEFQMFAFNHSVNLSDIGSKKLRIVF